MANKKENLNFWKSSNDLFQRGPFDSDVAATFADQQAKKQEIFGANTELIRAGQAYNSDAIQKVG